MNIYSYREPDRERERDFTVEIGGERSGEKDIIRASPRHWGIQRCYWLLQIIILLPLMLLMAFAFQQKQPPTPRFII